MTEATAELLLTDERDDGEIYSIVPQQLTGMLTLRPYQVEADDSAFEAWREFDALLMVLATGLGKTVIAANICLRWPENAGRILFVAHMKELINQAEEKIGLHMDDSLSVEMGNRRGHTAGGNGVLKKSKVVVASIQTLSRRLQSFDPKEFGLVIFDEAHHAAADSYRRAWKYFKDGNPDVKALLVTATPYRGDKLSLGAIAEHCCFEMGIREGIDDGYLVPIVQQYVVVEGLDFSRCRVVAKDLNESDLEEAMMGAREEDGMTDDERREAIEKQERMLHAIAAPTVRESKGRSTLVFCVTIAHAERMAEVLRRYPGVTSECIFGHTPDDERRDRVDRFRKGQFQMLVVVGCASEGFDAPNVSVVVMARPTKQKGVYVQQIGRGTRAVPGLVDRYDTSVDRRAAIANSAKSQLLVLDFVGNSGRHKLISTADVLAGDMPPEVIEAVKQEMQESGEAKDIRAAAWKKKEEFDEEERKMEEERKRLVEERRRRQEEDRVREESRRARIRAEAEYYSREIDPFGHETAAERVQPRYRGGATDAQIRFLYALGIERETSMHWSKEQAGAVIGKRSVLSGGHWIMRFGKYRGMSLNNIPHAYLRWAAENIERPDFQQNLAQYRNEYRSGMMVDRQPGEDG